MSRPFSMRFFYNSERLRDHNSEFLRSHTPKFPISVFRKNKQTRNQGCESDISKGELEPQSARFPPRPRGRDGAPAPLQRGVHTSGPTHLGQVRGRDETATGASRPASVPHGRGVFRRRGTRGRAPRRRRPLEVGRSKSRQTRASGNKRGVFLHFVRRDNNTPHR